MKLPGYYSSGEFAKKAHITKKTVRYYDEHNILKPSYVNENGARFYNDDDFARLQQILFLKYLGFSLDDIKEMTLRNTDSNVMSESLHMQLGLVEERIEQMKLMKSALQEASEVIDEGRSVDWSHMLELVNINEMETRTANAIGDFNGALEDMPHYCVTIGIYEISHARKIRLGCFRNWHRAVVRRTAYGEATSDFPVSLLTSHPDINLKITEFVAALD